MSFLRACMSRCGVQKYRSITCRAPSARELVIAAGASSQRITLPNIPELFDPNFLDILLPPRPAPAKSTQPSTPMLDALQSTAHRILTENYSPAFSSTLSPTLDAFQMLRRGASSKVVRQVLGKAWAEDPALTLRIIWNLRSIHEGKSEKETFYRAFGWLFEYHPRTAITNLHLLVEPAIATPKREHVFAHGYWKDLLNILALAAVDQLQTPARTMTFLNPPRTPPARVQARWKRLEAKLKGKRLDTRDTQSTKVVVDADAACNEGQSKRSQVALEAHKNLLNMLEQPKFRALYIAIARLFSERLATDLRILDEASRIPVSSERQEFLKQITLAGKWAPTPGGSHDRVTNISTALASLLHHSQTSLSLNFPLGSDYSVTQEAAALLLRSLYQRWVLVPLRKATMVTETLMSAQRWTEIEYRRVSSVCMRDNTPHFAKHDEAGFKRYLTAVESGKRSITGATLLPHELVALTMAAREKSERATRRKEAVLGKIEKELAEIPLRVAEAQWRTLVQRLRESGFIENSIAICDVSGSMGAINSRFDKKSVEPIFPAVAMSLILAQLAKPPFSNGFVTFSKSPQFVQLDPAQSLVETITNMANSDWGMNTDLNAVFLDLLLPLAIKHRVKPEDMIKRLFVFSDMQFDVGRRDVVPYWSTEAVEAVDDEWLAKQGDDWQTNHDTISEAYAAAGYEMPQVVYWDLGYRQTVPVTYERKGVALMNGFSPSMLKVFMGESDMEEAEDARSGAINSASENKKDKFNPVDIMKKALGRRSYDNLIVVD